MSHQLYNCILYYTTGILSLTAALVVLPSSSKGASSPQLFLTLLLNLMQSNPDIAPVPVVPGVSHKLTAAP